MVRNRARAVAALATVALIGAMAGGTATAAVREKTLSNSKYAKAVCGVFVVVSSSAATFVSAYNAADSSDPATLQQQLVAAADQYEADLQTALKKVKKIQPESGGKKVAKIFIKYFQEKAGKFQEIIDKFKAADATNVAFQADVTQFQVAFQTLDVEIGDPFQKVKDQDVLGALHDAKSCKKVVQIFGG